MKSIFAKDHKGMRVNGLRFLQENGAKYTFVRREIARHLEEVARRYYAGDSSVVDEFLQLYCIGEEERAKARSNQFIK